MSSKRINPFHFDYDNIKKAKIFKNDHYLEVIELKAAKANEQIKELESEKIKLLQKVQNKSYEKDVLKESLNELTSKYNDLKSSSDLKIKQLEAENLNLIAFKNYMISELNDAKEINSRLKNRESKSLQLNTPESPLCINSNKNRTRQVIISSFFIDNIHLII